MAHQVVHAGGAGPIHGVGGGAGPIHGVGGDAVSDPQADGCKLVSDALGAQSAETGGDGYWRFHTPDNCLHVRGSHATVANVIATFTQEEQERLLAMMADGTESFM